MSNRFFKTNFVFKANRYEEWQGGACISRGSIDTTIVAEVYGNEIHFELDNIGSIRMLKSCDFEIFDEAACILRDRIQYVHSSSDYNPVVPMICHIFNDGSSIEYVRFAMTNPDRIVEFYGRLVQLGQPNTGKKTKASTQGSVSAEKVFNELRGYGMLTSEAVMERAIKVYDDNFEIASIEQAKNMAEALKMFVKAYSLEKQKIENEEDWYEDEYKDGHKANPFIAKIMMFIAICNYKLNNIERAYYIAKQASDELDMALEQSPISIPKSMLGMDDLYQLISVIENNYADKVDFSRDYNEIDLTEIDTSSIDSVTSQTAQAGEKPSKELIKKMIDTISQVQSIFMKTAERLGSNVNGFQIKESLETFKMPLYFAWQGYKYGWHTDFCEDGDSLFPFLMFEARMKEMTIDLIEMLRTESPFAGVERNSMITNTLISIYTTFVNDLDNGTIKI